MASTWGTNFWGVNSFGTEVNTISVDGSQLASSIGQTLAFPELGWGGGEYGEQAWGALTDNGIVPSTLLATTALTSPTIETLTTVEVTGSSASITTGNATSDVLNNGWGARVWGFSVWGSVGDVILAGQSLSADIGTAIASIDVGVDAGSLLLSTQIGNAASRIDVEVIPTTLSLSTVIGNEDTVGSALVTPSGISASTNTGQATIDPTFLIGEGWGRDTYGNLAWGVNYSVIAAGPNGLSASIVTGNEDAFTDVLVEVTTAGELQTAITPVGTKANADHEIAASLLISSAQGDVSIEGTALVEPTSATATVSVGDAVGGTIQEVPVTGVSADINIGNEDTSGDANISLNGVSATLVPGQINYIASYDVTGVSAEFTLGDVTIEADANVTLTGIDLTMATGTPRITAWAEVNTGTQVVWTDVDLAA
jgi:hypothetical protein